MLSALSTALIIVFILGCIGLGIGLWNPRLVGFGYASGSRRVMSGSVFGVIAALSLVGWLLVPANAGQPSPSSTGGAVSTENTVSSGTAISSNQTAAKVIRPKQLSRKQLLNTLNWANAEYRAIYKAYGSEKPGTYDKSFFTKVNQTASALGIKSFQLAGNNYHPSPKDQLGEEQADVAVAVDDALSLVGDIGQFVMGEVPTPDQIQKDQQIYNKQYQKTLAEIQSH
ncbi:hypothetical protein [Alicyclobacillus acidiphilus]|uniref:hypothetical protein n=1 Tax=Alicyclobacillus acidiphilus TaxID=182455 RepID=UPI000831308A|nr:hypothetical protein [Alicyclobacillus acidiphilus]